VAGGGVENCVSEHEWARAAGFRGTPHPLASGSSSRSRDSMPRYTRPPHPARARSICPRSRRLFAAASRAPCPLLQPRFPLAASRFSSTPARLICCLSCCALARLRAANRRQLMPQLLAPRFTRSTHK
jgi:hypothetical protein